MNKKVVGKFKDEINGKIIEEFVGLAPKLYSIKKFGANEEIKRIKGIKKRIIRNQITRKDYKFCLDTEIVKCFTEKLFRSEKHVVYIVEQYKRGLNFFDDKRYVTKDSTDTLLWGHHKIDVPKENFIQHLKDLRQTVF